MTTKGNSALDDNELTFKKKTLIISVCSLLPSDLIGPSCTIYDMKYALNRMILLKLSNFMLYKSIKNIQQNYIRLYLIKLGFSKVLPWLLSNVKKVHLPFFKRYCLF